MSSGRAKATCWSAALAAIFKLIDFQRTDVVRLRNGGADHVICSTSATDDVLFVDRTDRLSPELRERHGAVHGTATLPVPLSQSGRNKGSGAG